MPCACLFGPMAQSHNARPSPASPLSRRDPSHGSKAPLGPAIWRWRAPMKKAALQGRRAGRLAVAQLFVARAPYSQSAPHLDNLRVERLSSANLTMTIARRATQQRHCSASASLMRASRALRKTSALRKSVGAWDWHGPFGAGGGGPAKNLPPRGGPDTAPRKQSSSCAEANCRGFSGGAGYHELREILHAAHKAYEAVKDLAESIGEDEDKR